MSEELIDRLERITTGLVQELDTLIQENRELRKKFEREVLARKKSEESTQILRSQVGQLNRLKRESERWAQEKQKIRVKAKNLLQKIDSADFL